MAMNKKGVFIFFVIGVLFRVIITNDVLFVFVVYYISLVVDSVCSW